MRQFFRLAWQLAVLMLFGAKAIAAEPFFWESNLDRAQQTAAQTNRLVLVHFWGPSCGWCKWMDAEVFAQAEVMKQIQANYVPVKINASQYPEIAKKYGIANLPTDVVLSPQGQMVFTAIGKSEAAPYVARLNQWAASARAPLAAVPASLPLSAPGANGNPLPMNSPLAATPPSAPVANPPSPSSGLSAPPAGPPLTLNGPANSPSAVARGVPLGADPPNATPNAVPPNNSPVFNNPPVANNAPPVNSQANVAPPNTPPVNPAAIPDRNPPLAFDGYCPVSLVEKQQWVHGDKRFGAYHQGRTYLFAGPEEQKKFLAAYDRYAPAASGMDIVLAVEEHKAVPGQRAHGVFFADHIFLFTGEATLQKFSANPTFYAGQPGRPPAGSLPRSATAMTIVVLADDASIHKDEAPAEPRKR